MLHQNLITAQTGPEGEFVSTVVVAEALPIMHEYYLSVVSDSSKKGIILIVGQQGGVDIEKLAEEDSSKISIYPVDPILGITIEESQKIAESMNLASPKLITKVSDDIRNLVRTFFRIDATQIEINPYGITDKLQPVCFDAKMIVDDSALFRQPEIAHNCVSFDNILIQKAKKHGMSYMEFDGDVGCIVNGAGLAMATMDLIKLHGSNPANFLDLGGGITPVGVNEAVKILSSHPKVKKIFINIFGGIVNCSVVSEGILLALNQINQPLKFVVRLQGNEKDYAIEMIKQSQHSHLFKFADELDTAAGLLLD